MRQDVLQKSDFGNWILDRKPHRNVNRVIPLATSYFLVLILGLAGGCVENNPQKALGKGYSSLEAKQYDDAMAQADAVLAKSPTGSAAAQALYLKGRALEERTKANDAEAAKNLQEARTAYIQALDQNPKQPLDAYIRTSLANVAYFQDDYKTAIEQWTAAYAGLDRDDVKAWVLYRIGLCHQRTSRFDQADRTFAQVQQQFPGTEPAKRAKDHQGARQYYLQVGAFSAVANADKVVADLKASGVKAGRYLDGSRYLVRVGPMSSYDQAKQTKTRLASKYPDAMIQP